MRPVSTSYSRPEPSLFRQIQLKSSSVLTYKPEPQNSHLKSAIFECILSRQMKIIIEPHNASWVDEFNRIELGLRRILADIPILSIEHVGSTSIPGLVAKPVLDIDIIVTSENVHGASAALTKAGYIACGDQGVSFRFAFTQPKNPNCPQGDGLSQIRGEMKRNTYIVVDGCIALRNHLDLKNMLLEHKELRHEYGDVKMKLVNSDMDSMDEYCRGKSDVVLKILEKAGWNEQDLNEVRMANS